MSDLMDAAHPMDKRRQCTATSKQSGERCKRAPISGGTVCKMHGGGSPSTVRAARQRLISAAHPAVARLLVELSTGDTSAARIRAAAEVLDRAGIPRGVTVEHNAVPSMLDEMNLEDLTDARAHVRQLSRNTVNELAAHMLFGLARHHREELR